MSKFKLIWDHRLKYIFSINRLIIGGPNFHPYPIYTDIHMASMRFPLKETTMMITNPNHSIPGGPENAPNPYIFIYTHIYIYIYIYIYTHIYINQGTNNYQFTIFKVQIL